MALWELDPDEREIVLWRHFELLGNADVARLLGIGEAAASKRYIRTIERLRGILLRLGFSGTE
jgi:RNA polymerase sigma-70 factor (ECF subfamily)